MSNRWFDCAGMLVPDRGLANRIAAIHEEILNFYFKWKGINLTWSSRKLKSPRPFCNGPSWMSNTRIISYLVGNEVNQDVKKCHLKSFRFLCYVKFKRFDKNSRTSSPLTGPTSPLGFPLQGVCNEKM
jgi:hypothetical protein